MPESRVYLTIQVFSFPEGTPFAAPPHDAAMFGNKTVAFVNTANAVAVFEDCCKPLERALAKGIHERGDRMRPGPAPKTQTETLADAHAANVEAQRAANEDPKPPVNDATLDVGFAQPE